MVSSGPLDQQFIGGLAMTAHDILLVDWQEDADRIAADLLDRLDSWHTPVLFNDSTATRISLQQGNPGFGRMLERQLNARLAVTVTAPDDRGST